MFEHFIHNKDDPQFEKMIGIIDKSKKDLMAIGYDEIAIEDFHDIFLT